MPAPATKHPHLEAMDILKERDRKEKERIVKEGEEEESLLKSIFQGADAKSLLDKWRKTLLEVEVWKPGQVEGLNYYLEGTNAIIRKIIRVCS